MSDLRGSFVRLRPFIHTELPNFPGASCFLSNVINREGLGVPCSKEITKEKPESSSLIYPARRSPAPWEDDADKSAAFLLAFGILSTSCLSLEFLCFDFRFIRVPFAPLRHTLTAQVPARLVVLEHKVANGLMMTDTDCRHPL